jgi:hypothetical protein
LAARTEGKFAVAEASDIPGRFEQIECGVVD